MLLYNSPVIPLSVVEPSVCLSMPENNVTRIYSIISIHLKNVIKATVEPTLFTVIFSNALENATIISNYSVCISISTCVWCTNR